MERRAGPVLLAIALGAAAGAELPPEWADWNLPVEPFTIAGNVHYVGTKEIAAFLLTSPEGHVLIDGGFVQSVPHIRRSIEGLGFCLQDVRVLLNSHAHCDHSGGLAALRELSGAALVASRGDAPLLRSGGEEGDPPHLRFPPVAVDRVVEDGERISLGGTTLIARVTAGHTPGCTTWTTTVTEGGRTLDVVFMCSVSALPQMDLQRRDAAYPEGREAIFARAFDTLEALPCDVFLAPHSAFFQMRERLARRAAGETANPFVDPHSLREHVQERRRGFMEELERQRLRGPGAAAGP